MMGGRPQVAGGSKRAQGWRAMMFRRGKGARVRSFDRVVRIHKALENGGCGSGLGGCARLNGCDRPDAPLIIQ